MTRPLIIALLAGIAAASTPLLAQDPGAKRQSRPKSPVKVEMEKLEEAIDAIASFIKAPKGDAPLAEIAAAQVALHKAKQHAPRTMQGKPEDQQAAFVADYKIQINKTIRMVLDLEDALIQKDWEVAGDTLLALEKLQKAGHRKFKGRRRRR